MQLNLHLFGLPRVERDGQLLDLNLRKGLALLAYLAVTRRSHSRDLLATLLWPEKDQRSARANLRRTLYDLGQALGEQTFEPAAERIGLHDGVPLWIDVEQFRRCVAESAQSAVGAGHVAHLEQAAGLYTADFMAGFTLPDCPEYDEWQFFQREELLRSFANVLAQLVALYEGQKKWREAVRHARRWLALDPLEEPVHRRLMQLYARAGQTGAALRQYEECRRILAQEFDAPPEEETTALYYAIRTRRFPPPDQAPLGPEPDAAAATVDNSALGKPSAPAPAVPSAVFASLHALPTQTTPFVGRRQELAEVLRRLRDPSCRLLTLVGPGGIGKTRLALEAARALQGRSGSGADIDTVEGEADSLPQFKDGIVFVALQPVSAPSGIAPSIADALGLQFYGGAPIQEQLLDYVRSKEMLLLLDNFEHLLAGTDLVSGLLTAAPGVKVLATSREALKLHEEWFHPLAGMRLPPAAHARPSGEPGEGEQFPETNAAPDAVQLFAQTAQRALVSFDAETELKDIVRICRLVDGMPLGIELAASWLKVLSCAQIADEIERGMDILVARHQNVPARHRSMRVVLDHSWALLSEDAQAVLQRLSVFQGGFLPEAAAVAEANLLTLADLVDTSWIYRGADGRYQMHELLRQYAASKLAEAPAAAAAVQERHAAYYLQQVAQQEATLFGPEQREALEGIGADIDNVRAAWLTAVECGAWGLVNGALQAFYSFFYMRSGYMQGEELLKRALQQLEQAASVDEESSAVRLRLLARLGVFLLHQGDLKAAAGCFLAVQSGSSDPHELAFVYTNQGVLAKILGNRPAAEAALQQGLALAQEIGDRNQTAEALLMLSDVLSSFGSFVEGARLAGEASELGRQLQRPELAARAVASLAWATSCLGDYTSSDRYYRESLAISVAIDNSYGIAIAVQFLGWVAFCAGGDRLAEAVARYEQALMTWRQIGHRINVAMCLGDYVLAAWEMGDYATAVRCGTEGLAVAEQLQHLDLMSYNLYGLAAAAASLHDFAAARRNLLRSLQIAHSMQMRDNVAATLYVVAHLAVEESKAAGVSAVERQAKQAWAVELLSLVIHQPATWQLFRDRAERRQADLMAGLSAEIAAAALERGRQRLLEEVVAELLDGGLR